MIGFLAGLALGLVLGAVALGCCAARRRGDEIFADLASRERARRAAGEGREMALSTAHAAPEG